MKHTFIFSCLLATLLWTVACELPGDGLSSKGSSSQAKVEKESVSTAPVAATSSDTPVEPAEERDISLAAQSPLDVEHVYNQTPNVDLDFLRHSFERNQQVVQSRLQREYYPNLQEQVNTYLTQHQAKMRQALQTEQTPAETTNKLLNALDEYQQQMKKMLTEQQANARLKPTEKILERVHERLEQRCEDFLNNVTIYYGDKTALESRPVLEKALQRYEAALAESASEEELSNKVQGIVENTRTQLDEIISKTGDPLGVTSEEMITSLRSEMIANHQKLENQIEQLYGKQAVLQARKPFNQLLEDTEITLQEDMRLSQKKNTLARFNHHYQESIGSLLQQWSAKGSKKSN